MSHHDEAMRAVMAEPILKAFVAWIEGAAPRREQLALDFDLMPETGPGLNLSVWSRRLNAGGGVTVHADGRIRASAPAGAVVPGQETVDEHTFKCELRRDAQPIEFEPALNPWLEQLEMNLRSSRFPLLETFATWHERDRHQFQTRGVTRRLTGRGLQTGRPSATLVLDHPDVGANITVWHDGGAFAWAMHRDEKVPKEFYLSVVPQCSCDGLDEAFSDVLEAIEQRLSAR